MIKRIIPFLLLSFIFLSCNKEKIAMSFHEVETGAAGDLNGIFFVNDSIGYACGGERYSVGDMLKTTDGGQTWKAQQPNTGKVIYQPFFLNNDTGIAAAYEGKFVRTMDGGKNWQLYQYNLWIPARNILFLNDSTAIACGGGAFKTGIIFRTTDMGNSWAADTFGNELRGLYFTDSKTGYCSGYGIILKTTDAGLSWQTTSAKGDFFTSVYFTNANTGFAVGMRGSIIKTEDAGASWKEIRNGNSLLNSSLTFTQVVFRNASVGYAIGWNGLMMKTTDGGNSWATVSSTPSADFNSIVLLRNGGYIAASGGRIYSFTE